MNYSRVPRLSSVLAVCVLGTASPIFAQFTPQSVSQPAMGETFHIEGQIGIWSPTAELSISSESLGIPGNTIDFKSDLGLTDQKFRELHLVLRPARRHKLRFQYIPIGYTQGPVVISHDLDPHDGCVGMIFNGQCYPLNATTSSNLEWKAYRFTYEYDLVAQDRWFAGLMLEAKYTDVTARLQTKVIDQYAHARLPVPAIGPILRIYPIDRVSLTGELSLFRIPDAVSDQYHAHYTDFDTYGTVNITRNFGATVGYRSFDVGYLVKKDTGSLTLKGLYFGAVARY